MLNKKHDFKNWNEFYQRYVLIFNLIVVFSLVPFGWMYLQLEHGRFQPYFEDEKVQWIGAAILIPLIAVGLYKSYTSTRNQIREMAKRASIRVKLAEYYKLQISKFVKYELLAITSMIGMLVFQPEAFAIFYIFILFMFSLDWPKYIKVVEHLRLSKEEQEILASADELPK